MVRKYSWQLRMRSYEGDAWRQLSTSGWLRYFEQVAVDGAADLGYDRAFHLEHGTSWVIRRMTLQIHAPLRIGDAIDINTWPSHQDRVRGWREYEARLKGGGGPVATALGEWVYFDMRTGRPTALPTDWIERAEPPGVPLNSFEPPTVAPIAGGPVFSTRRTARWHECDSMQHVNNCVYADWLDEAVRAAVTELGFPTAHLKDTGVQLRGTHYKLDYKRAVLPEDELVISTRITGASGELCSVEQSIRAEESDVEFLSARSVHSWLSGDGEVASPPEGWEVSLSS